MNVLAVVGLSSLVSPDGLVVASSMVTFDIPIAIATAAACLPIFWSGSLIARWEGALFLACYAAYTLYLIGYAAEHDALSAYSTVMLAFVLPLTAVTVVVLAAREIHAGRNAPDAGGKERTLGGY